MPEETKSDEILEAINHFANQTEKRFNTIESTMVTKDFLEDKIADLRGDLVLLTRKEDKKVNTLIEILQEKKVLNEDEAKKVMSMAPYAQIS